MDTKVLKNLGFSDAEIKVYTTLLKLKLTTTGQIIKKSGLQKSTVYYSLDNLIKNGFVHASLKNNIKHFEAENPNILFEKAKNINKELSNLIPQLKALQKPQKEEVKSTIYEGFKAVTSSLQHRLSVLKSGDEIMVMGARSGNPKSKAAIILLKNINNQRVKRKIKMRIIFNKDIKNTETTKFYEELPMTKVKYIKEITPAGIAIYKDFVFTLVWTNPKDPVSILTQSKEIADSYKQFFQRLWKSTK
jgi:sugar-specific transcriptional regulator TrmB